MNTKEITSLLREERQRKGLLLKDVAARMRIDGGYLSNVEHGRYNVTLDVLCRYLDAIDSHICVKDMTKQPSKAQ